MITKKEPITTCEVKLEGGDAPADVRGVYHPITIENTLGMIFDDLVNDDPQMAEQMALEFSVTAANSAFTLTKPISTTSAVYDLVFGGESYNIANPHDYSTYRKINPSLLVFKLDGLNGTLSKQPVNPSGTILYIPRFRSLAQTDYIMLEKNLTKMFDMLVQRLRQEEMQEKINNSVRDIPNVRARQ